MRVRKTRIFSFNGITGSAVCGKNSGFLALGSERQTGLFYNNSLITKKAVLKLSSGTALPLLPFPGSGNKHDIVKQKDPGYPFQTPNLPAL
jgi:hypothetical protein